MTDTMTVGEVRFDEGVASKMLDHLERVMGNREWVAEARRTEPGALTGKNFESVFGGFSKPSKMPGLSWSTPALVTCKVGRALSKLPGSVCSGCYALKGRYVFPSTKHALARRLKALDSNPNSVAAAMVYRLRTMRSERARFMRWHDSGDVIDEGHYRLIQWIARMTPNTQHWLPTREVALVRRFGKDDPPNLCSRVSNALVGSENRFSDVPCTSTVDAPPTDAHDCPAPSQGGKCGSCRACWNRTVRTVNYSKH